MTKTEAVDELEFLKETFPKEPPEECDYLDEWYDSHKKLINAINMGCKTLVTENPDEYVALKDACPKGCRVLSVEEMIMENYIFHLIQ